MTPLLAQLHTRIRREGPLTFAQFMDTALYDAELGYYASGKARIGREGDFYTAVSVGALFGKLLARQFIEMWGHLGAPAAWTLVEQGAFDGQLALDVLSAIQAYSPECFGATSLLILEPFSTLKKRQAETLAAFHGRVQWHSSLEALPRFRGVHFSNELLDAFPFHRLKKVGDQWLELKVASEGASLFWEESPIACPELAEAAEQLPPVLEGAHCEVSLGHRNWLSSILKKMDQGWLLAFDYGMSESELLAPRRAGGTAVAYKAHRQNTDLLETPGEQDLTAQVNFSAVARDALARGWELEGYTDQHRFFTGLAPLHFRDLEHAPTREERDEALAFRSLSHPALMGTRFKALCLASPGNAGMPEGMLSGLRFARSSREALGMD